MDLCALCGRPAECTHHLIFGQGRRKLCNEDQIIITLCNNCHNLATKPYDRIHGNPTAEKLSKMLGQAIYEREYYRSGNKGDAQSDFMKRYGRSYL